jgi:hypothetical protein
MAPGSGVEEQEFLGTTMTYRYTAWSPYASPITIPARDSKVISQAHFSPAGPLIAGRPFVRSVALDTPPDGPGSVQTELVDLSWAVHARLHITKSRDAEATTPIVVLSQARDCAPVADAPPVLVVASLLLADHIGLEASRPLRFEFTLPVPPQLPAPTMRMPNFTLSWMLRGVVDRQLRRDPCVAVELHTATTRRELERGDGLLGPGLERAPSRPGPASPPPPAPGRGVPEAGG